MELYAVIPVTSRPSYKGVFIWDQMILPGFTQPLNH